MDRVLELDEIQGNVLGGFNTDFQTLLGLTLNDPAEVTASVQWLADLAPSVTVASEVRAQRRLMLEAAPEAETIWLGLAVSHRLLKAARPDVYIRDEAFSRGMVKRAPSVLGDLTDPVQWRVGGPKAPLDVLLVVAGNRQQPVADRAEELKNQAAKAGLTATYMEAGRRLDHREHFGFRDGISQPSVLGLDAIGLGPGHFVFGYPKDRGGPPFSPAVDPGSVTDNGSLLVFRRLLQNVPAFRTFCTDEAARVAADWPGLTSEHLAALLVGRWPSGAPIRAGQTADPGAPPPGQDFDFRDDPDATSCPFGAHIRKLNPRGGRADILEVPRMLRRGIPFGPEFDVVPEVKDRGLLFVAFQSSIKSQFEFLTQNWMNSAVNPGPGHDVLVGRAATLRSLRIVGPRGPVEIRAGVSDWIVPTGGAYLFAPSRSGVAKLAAPSPPFGLWKARQLLARTADALSESWSRRPE